MMGADLIALPVAGDEFHRAGIVAFAALAMAAVFLYLGVRFKQAQVRVQMTPPGGPADGAGPWR